jgi:hypothetical protein
VIHTRVGHITGRTKAGSFAAKRKREPRRQEKRRSAAEWHLWNFSMSGSFLDAKITQFVVVHDP